MSAVTKRYILILTDYSPNSMSKSIFRHDKTTAVAEMGDRARAKWAEKWGLNSVPLYVGGAGPDLV